MPGGRERQATAFPDTIEALGQSHLLLVLLKFQRVDQAEQWL